ncbi:MAG TPA: NADH-quinone oxidoreductase subunit L [Methylovorus sp.]|nr:NADH-quinone oxidoreductase subunit L [Methylovorus sp.]
MSFLPLVYKISALAPLVLMAAVALLATLGRFSTASLWQILRVGSFAALAMAVLAVFTSSQGALWPGVVQASALSMVTATLVQLLGTVIGGFSSRYLQGEAGQPRYIAALAAVLAAVHLLVLADHWLVLIGAWAFVGVALQYLLCFYADRPFALLAAHKKRIADRLADVLLIIAAALAWLEVGSGSLSALREHVLQQGISPTLQISAVTLVLAVILRTALLPVHGWLIQVMEAPTPVSALLHAGVVNLGGFVLIQFAPLLEQATPARMLLLIVGLATAVLAGMVMLTRVSIKVRLAWSTVAQMGFLLMECALGLYTLAALHLLGHSLYKAHAFLSASSVVRETRLHALHGTTTPSATSLVWAPLVTIATLLLATGWLSHGAWPWWWSVVLGLAWAPLLWLPAGSAFRMGQLLMGLLMVLGLAVAAIAAHALPLALHNAPHTLLGLIALAGMTALYLCQAILQRWPEKLARWRRWSYAGFYVDEAYTRLALQLWPTRWTPQAGTTITSGDRS